MIWKLNKITKTIALSTTTLSIITLSNFLHAATQLGQGIYYDESQITKLAQQYPGRVSKDAGYPLIDNYSTLKSAFRGSQFGLINKPITSGLWWTPLLAVDKNASQIQDRDYLSPLMVIPNPLTIGVNDSGISLGIPLQKANIDNVHIDRGYDNTLDVTVSTGDLSGTAPLVADYSDWMVKVQWAQNNSPLLAATLVEGSPFIFIEKKNKQNFSYLRFNNSQEVKLVSQTSGLSLFKTKNASSADYRYYALYSNPVTSVSPWKTSTGAVITPVNQGGSGTIVPSTQINMSDSNPYFSVAIIPATTDSAAVALANQMQAHAYNFIKNTSISYQYDQINSQVISNFNFNTQTVYPNPSLKTQPLVMLYPWQIKNMSSAEKANCFLQDECAGNNGIIQTLKGTMHLFTVPVTSPQTNAASFSIQIPFNGVLPVLPNLLTQTQLNKIGNYSFSIPPDPHLDAKNPWTDTYATGKLLSREAQLIKIANVLMGSSASPDPKYQNIRDSLLVKLKAQITSFLTGLNYTDACPGGTTDCQRPEGAWFYAYNSKWHSLMGFPSGFFTATTLTDHSFHWGYLIDGAATVAQFDKTWAQQYGALVNLVIRDIWNYKYGNEAASDPLKFPHFRSFDPYSGLSSALGMPYSFDNINEEDSAEFMNLAQAIILWALNTEGVAFQGDDTSPQSLLETGLYLYTTESEGLNHYHFNQNPSAGVFPIGWSNTSTGQTYLSIGNVWGGKMDRSTYFCAGQPCYYQDLASNTLPISAGSLYLGYDPNFVLNVYNLDAKTPCSGDPANTAYCGTLLKYLALGAPDKALSYYTNYFDLQGNIPDPGESLPSIYYWIQNLQNLGTLNKEIKADYPAYAVFGSNDKIYVSAYNNESQTRQVNFYKDGNLICTLENILPGEIKGSYCGSTPPPPSSQFAYTIYVGYPFNPVRINNTMTCPDPITKNPSCLIKGIVGNSTMLITGSNSNVCTLSISSTGAVTPLPDKSKGCNINSKPATPTEAGIVNLPGGF